MNNNIQTAGEVAAIRGYDFQYTIFAQELYDALLNDSDSIEWVEFASSEAGKVDDVLIGLQSTILAFQVKHVTSATFTYAGFTNSPTQSILNGMYVGWEKLAATYPTQKVDIRLITTQKVSDNDHIIDFAGVNKPSFSDLLQQFWLPAKDSTYGLEHIPSDWLPVFDALKQMNDSTSKKMLGFIKATSFRFNYELPVRFNAYIERQRRIDIEGIAAQIFKTVAKKGNVRYSKSQFLNEFGLMNRYESYYRHNFFVDDAHYQPINESITELDNLTARHDRGYIALIGNAGSGKSTLLTKWLQTKDFKILRYYAYVNTEMNYEYGFRGEAAPFLHDLLIQIRQTSPSLQDRLPSSVLLDLQRHFNDELLKLSRANEKVIIVVDGLDHIEREQQVTLSLLSILPLAENIPQNIYFILGSRTIENLQNLPARIKSSITNDNRIVPIASMTKGSIQTFLRTYSIELTDELLEQLFINTKGHPLFLRYTVEAIRNHNGEDLSDIILQRVFSGDIEKEYKLFWNSYKEIDDFIEILGIIARFRYSFFDISTLNSFPALSRSSQYKVHRLSENYFYKNGTTWQFFHNSFKEFLVTETKRDVLTGLLNEEKDRSIHLNIYKTFSAIEHEYSWNSIYHLSRAEDYQTLIAVSTQTYFRKQWFAFRNYKSIKEDIEITIAACIKLHDIYKLFDCFLALYELKQRYKNFDPANHVQIFHVLGETTIANSFIYDNVELLVPKNKALEYAVNLFKIGATELAYDLFLRSTPSYILDQSKSVSANRYSPNNYYATDEVKLITSWAKAACLFGPVAPIISKVDEMTVENEPSENQEPELQPSVFDELTAVSIETKNWNNLKTLEQYAGRGAFFFYYDIVTILPNEDAFYDHCLKELSNWKISNDNRVNRRLLYIHIIINNDIEKAKPLFDNLLVPNSLSKDDYSIQQTELLNYIFDYSRYFYIVTKSFSTSPAMFLPVNTKHTVRAFHMALAELGRSHAYIFHNYRDAATGYYQNFNQLLALFHYDHLDYGYEYSLAENKALAINLILEISSKLSVEIFSEILERLNIEWKEKKRFWRIDQKQQVIEWIANSGFNKEWAIVQLKNIEEDLFVSGYVNDRIDKAITQIVLWSGLNENDKARNVLAEIMDISLDVRGEKDYQLDYIVDWIKIFQTDQSDEIQFYLDRVNSLLERVNSRTHTPAGSILDLSGKYNNGIAIFNYFIFEGLLSFSDGLESVLNYLLSALPSENKIIIKLFIRIVLGYDNYSGERHAFLANLLNYSTFKNPDDLRDLVNEIKICSISEYCDEYLYTIQKYAQSIGIDGQQIGIDKIIEPNKTEPDRNTDELILHDGRKLSKDEVLQQITSIEELEALRKDTPSYNGFNWSPIYLKLFESASDDNILNFVLSGKYTSNDLVPFAETLISLSRSSLLKRILYQAIKNGEKYGWVTFVDGGSKIVPFELLKDIEDRTIFQEHAFNDFATCVSSFDINSFEILLKDIPKIWSFFSENVNFEILYDKLKEYRTELLKTQIVDINAPKTKGEIPALMCLTDLLFFLITFPSDFNYSIYQILNECDNGNNITREILKRLRDQHFNCKYLRLLAVTSSNNLDLIFENETNLAQLINHSRYDTHSIARALLTRIDIDTKLHYKKGTKNFPLAYELDFEYTPSFDNSVKTELSNIDNDGFLKDTEDILAWARLYLTEIRLLSDHTGIPIINIAHRVKQLGTELEFPVWCNTISENEIRNIYSGRFDLEVSYKRPRNQLVWDGLMKVVKELWELDLIESDLADELSIKFDADAYLIKPVPKPSFVPSIINGSSGSAPSADEKWAKEITKGDLAGILNLRLESRDYILAEYSTIRGMGWGSAEEVRQGFVSTLPKINTSSARELIFNMLEGINIKEYPASQKSGLIWYNGLFTVNKKMNWLAFNSAIAKSMGLIHNTQGLFRWDTEYGVKIFDSVYWQLHSTDNYSRNHHSEAGYGWYVVLYKEGLDLFRSYFGDKELYHHKKVSRHMRYSQQRYQTKIEDDFYQLKSERVIIH